MPVEAMPPRAPSTRVRLGRRTTADRMREALLALADHRGQIINHAEKPWASITFAGTRHSVAILFAGDEAVAAGDTFIAELPEHEFALPRQLVADATVTGVDHRLAPSPRLVVECDLLLLEES